MLPSHSVPKGAPGAVVSMTRKVPPYLLAEAVVEGGAGEAGAEVEAGGLLAGAEVAVVATGAVDEDGGGGAEVWAGTVVAVLLEQPAMMKAATNNTATGISNFFTLFLQIFATTLRRILHSYATIISVY